MTKLTKKKLTGGSNNNNFVNAAKNFNDCTSCKGKKLKKSSMCNRCKKKTKGKASAKSGISASVIVPSAGAGAARPTVNIIPFYSGELENIGRFRYRLNSCWIDSTLFGLFSLGNTQVIDTLFVNPLAINEDFRALSRNLSDEHRMVFLRIFRHRLIYAHNAIMVGGGVDEFLDSFKIRSAFNYIQRLREFSTSGQNEVARLIGSIFTLFSPRMQHCLEYREIEVRKYHRDRPVDLRIIPFNGQRIRYGRRSEHTHNVQEPIFNIPNYRLREGQRLSELLFGRNLQNEIFDDVVDGVRYITRFTETQFQINCLSNYLIVEFSRFGTSMTTRQTTRIIPDQFITCSNGKRLELHVIIMRDADRASSGAHFTCYFKYGEVYALFNDMGASITRVGTYDRLIQQSDALTRSIIYIYQERRVQETGYETPAAPLSILEPSNISTSSSRGTRKKTKGHKKKSTKKKNPEIEQLKKNALGLLTQEEINHMNNNELRALMGVTKSGKTSSPSLSNLKVMAKGLLSDTQMKTVSKNKLKEILGITKPVKPSSYTKPSSSAKTSSPTLNNLKDMARARVNADFPVGVINTLTKNELKMMLNQKSNTEGGGAAAVNSERKKLEKRAKEKRTLPDEVIKDMNNIQLQVFLGDFETPAP